MERRRILVLGAQGQVGFQLMRALAPLGEVTGTVRDPGSRHAVDLLDHASLEAAFVAIRPHLVVNAVAYTAVDRAEQERDLAMAINAAAVGVLGDLAVRYGASLVHYSTDYVFSGSVGRPWREDDETNPANVYGRSKLAGEQALVASGVDAIILRTSWIYDRRGRNFLLTMRRLLAEREEVRVVAGETSWFGFAEAIRDLTGAGCCVHPIDTVDYPLPAPRPMDSRLDNGRLEAVFGLRLPDWREALSLCLEEDAGV